MLSRYLNLCLQFLTMNKKDFIWMTSTNNLIIVCCNTNTHCPISHEIKAIRQWNLTSFFFFFFFENLYMMEKQMICSWVSIFVDIPQLGIQQKTNCMETLDWSRDILKFDFQRRFQEEFLHHIFRITFQQKCSSSCILLTDQILLSDCLYIFRYWVIAMCIAICVCSPVVTSEI